MRVPADRLDQLIDSIAGLGHVTNRTSQVVDATEDVVDLDARVASQRASVDRVRALLSEARSIGDVVVDRVGADPARGRPRLADGQARRAQGPGGAVHAGGRRGEGADHEAEPGPQPNGFLAGLAAGWDGLKATASATRRGVGFLVPFLPVVAVLLGLVWVGRGWRVARTAGAPRRAGRRGPEPERGSQDRATPREPLAATAAVRGPAGAL